jgi:hypothetical protein
VKVLEDAGIEFIPHKERGLGVRYLAETRADGKLDLRGITLTRTQAGDFAKHLLAFADTGSLKRTAQA